MLTPWKESYDQLQGWVSQSRKDSRCGKTRRQKKGRYLYPGGLGHAASHPAAPGTARRQRAEQRGPEASLRFLQKVWTRWGGQLRTDWSGWFPQAPGHSAHPWLYGTCPGWRGQVDGGPEGGSRWRRRGLWALGWLVCLGKMCSRLSCLLPLGISRPWRDGPSESAGLHMSKPPLPPPSSGWLPSGSGGPVSAPSLPRVRDPPMCCNH